MAWSFLIHFKNISDPRIDRTRVHYFLDIIGMTVCGVLAGAEGWDGIYDFVEARLDWFKTFLTLENGIPSPDTIRRVISRIKPEEFESAFSDWVSNLTGKLEGLVSIDGKTICNKRSNSPLHLVSAWASANGGICLGQVATGDKGGEFEAIPKLLNTLNVAGCLITIDAAGCNKQIAEGIVKDNAADYCLTVKENQPILFNQLKDFFVACDGAVVAGKTRHITMENGHGRIEKRTTYSSRGKNLVPTMNTWCEAKTIGTIIRERTIGEKTSIEKHYYISSAKLTAKALAATVRGHWGIENSLHWVLDVTFREDGNRLDDGSSQQNIAIARKIALTMLKNEKSKLSVARKKFRATVDSGYMSKVLGLL